MLILTQSAIIVTSFQLLMGGIAIAVTLVAYVPYLRLSLSSAVQPHPFSWLLWALVTGVAYRVQVTQGGGAGSWVTGLTALVCLCIAIISFLKNDWRFTVFDWLSLALGLFVLLYYVTTHEPTKSAILATLADTIGYAPTLKKGWLRPYSDSISSFGLNSLKFVPGLLALSSISIATCVYPATLIVMNALVALLLLSRRHAVRKSTS